MVGNFHPHQSRDHVALGRDAQGSELAFKPLMLAANLLLIKTVIANKQEGCRKRARNRQKWVGEGVKWSFWAKVSVGCSPPPSSRA